ncbi:MAG: extracellular solute-binding protein [Ruminococcaceae bacterium]|nr:extracellular solute-binding protein [Oscillospiraceae bacterium]
MKKLTILSLLLALALIFTSCGNTASQAASTLSSVTPMGRWVDDDITPSGLTAGDYPEGLWQTADGALHYFEISAETRALTHLISSDGGDTWQPQDTAWAAQLGESIDKICVSQNGTIYATTYNESGVGLTLWRKASDGDAQKLEAENLDVCDMTRKLYPLNDDTLILCASSTQQAKQYNMLLNAETGEVAKTLSDNFSNEANRFAAVPDGALFVYMNESYDMTLNGMDAKGDALPSTGTVELENFPLASCADKNGNFYTLDEFGISRIASGGTLIETILDSAKYAFGVPSNSPRDLAYMQNGDIVVALSDASSNSTKLYRYRFDTALPAVAEKSITVWSLRDMPTVRAALSTFLLANKDVDVNYEVALPAGETSLSADDIIRTLNTEILAGEGPDVIIFDGVDYQSYIDKGLLADLPTIVDKTALGAMLPTVTAPFYKGESAYVLPMRFGIPCIFGSAATLDALTTPQALADAVAAGAVQASADPNTSEFYESLDSDKRCVMAFHSVDAAVEYFYGASAPLIIQNNAVNEGALTAVLSQIHAVCGHYGIVTQEESSAYGMSLTTGLAGNGATMVGGEFNQFVTASANSAVETLLSMNLLAYATTADGETDIDVRLMPSAVEGLYMPKMLSGISAASKHIDIAADFVAALLDAKTQQFTLGDGLPVTKAQLDAQVAAFKESQAKGEGIVGDATVNYDINALVAALKTPLTTNESVRDAIYTHADAMCSGKETLEEAVKGVENDLSIYLSERK